MLPFPHMLFLSSSSLNNPTPRYPISTVGLLYYAPLTSPLRSFADKIAEQEFISGVMKNEEIMKLIQYDPKKK